MGLGLHNVGNVDRKLAWETGSVRPCSETETPPRRLATHPNLCWGLLGSNGKDLTRLSSLFLSI